MFIVCRMLSFAW